MLLRLEFNKYSRWGLRVISPFHKLASWPILATICIGLASQAFTDIACFPTDNPRPHVIKEKCF